MKPGWSCSAPAVTRRRIFRSTNRVPLRGADSFPRRMFLIPEKTTRKTTRRTPMAMPSWTMLLLRFPRRLRPVRPKKSWRKSARPFSNSKPRRLSGWPNVGRPRRSGGSASSTRFGASNLSMAATPTGLDGAIRLRRSCSSMVSTRMPLPPRRHRQLPAVRRRQLRG